MAQEALVLALARFEPGKAPPGVDGDRAALARFFFFGLLRRLRDARRVRRTLPLEIDLPARQPDVVDLVARRVDGPTAEEALADRISEVRVELGPKATSHRIAARLAEGLGVKASGSTRELAERVGAALAV